ncbi:MAG: hypothetical protein LKG56_06295 [Lachnospiraceae bacterium]|jgi:hypothetical protein|nr:hypothetical protein [Lachnospiraceae bacterium]MCH4070066.1 hypothetical protein [Lachnospiraceae bacterium]MCH4108582.1 hypothetical protein [Lachnospiraceae bacterium]MCI1302701.1 hypothetical protein [Lachnospiraceae bacterium]MCI1331885.1 hypothetical protein [Lachnospiraceae bacterium]
MKSFPFPDRVHSRDELKRDVLYEKIPEEDRIPICDKAWDTGVEAARCIMQEYGERTSIQDIAAQCGLVVKRLDRDNVAGNMRYFSEYYAGRNTIFMYSGGIARWAEENHFTYDQAEELILSHEFFHYLEQNKIGETAKQYEVPTVKIGKHILVKVGVRALCEIGAHGFSRTYYEIRRNVSFEDCGTYVRNAAVDINNFERAVSAEKFREFISGMTGAGTMKK